MTRTPLRDRPTARYRFYGDDGGSIYIGIAVDPPSRWAFHQSVAPWWHLVDHNRTIVDWYPNRPAAEAAEVEAIGAECPAYNTLHTDRSLRSAPRPSRWANARANGIGTSPGRRILMSVQETRAQLRAVVSAVENDGQRVIVVRHSKPVVVFVPMDWYREATAKMGEPTEL